LDVWLIVYLLAFLLGCHFT